MRVLSHCGVARGSFRFGSSWLVCFFLLGGVRMAALGGSAAREHVASLCMTGCGLTQCVSVGKRLGTNSTEGSTTVTASGAAGMCRSRRLHAKGDGWTVATQVVCTSRASCAGSQLVVPPFLDCTSRATNSAIADLPTR